MAAYTPVIQVIKKLNSPTEVAWTSSAESTADTADTYTFALKHGGADLILLIDNSAAAGTASAGSVTYSFGAGILGCPPSVNDTEANVIESGDMAAVRVDSAFVTAADGKLTLTVTPPDDGNLSACGLRVAALETCLGARADA